MDATRHTGIKIDSVDLIDCSASVNMSDSDLKFNLGLTCMRRSISDDKTKMVVVASFDMMIDVDNPPCKLECTFSALYSLSENANMTWEEFTDVMAVTHMIPYVREFASSVTLRMPLKELIIPPTNVNVLLSEFNRRNVADNSVDDSS